MTKKRLSVLLLVVVLGGTGLWLVIQYTASNPVTDATQPLTGLHVGTGSTPSAPLIRPSRPQVLGSEAGSNDEEERTTLPAGPSGPLPPDLPTILLTDKPIVPSPLTTGVQNLPAVLPSPETRPEFEIGVAPKRAANAASGAAPTFPALVLGAMPTPTLSFNGMDFSTNGAGHPPDPNGDVGIDHYMEAVNTSIGIYSKTTGAKATAFFFNSFWFNVGTGTACDTSNQGDPIVLFDAINQRWIFMDFAWTNLQNGPYYFCFGVSQTSNPLGNYWRYAIRADDASHPWLPDYPKGGVWPDGLYFSANMFDCLNSSCSAWTYGGARTYAFNLQKMEAGENLMPNDVQAKDLPGSYYTLMPSNARGDLPPANTPNYFVTEDPNAGSYNWNVFQFHVDFTNPASSTLTGPVLVSQAPYTGAADAVPEPAPGNNSDTLADIVMFPNQYRNINGVESLWVQHTTGLAGAASASTPTGIQWAQIDVTGGTIATTPVQQQIFNNGLDGLNRFMGSIAVDRQGNVALGYTASSASVAPDIRYVGRLASDPLNQMPQAETTLLPNVTRSVQTGNCGGAACARWGDYSAMSVDPVDDCTFWYVNMYFPVQGPDWVTRIGTFKYPSCSAATPVSDTLTSVSSSPNPSAYGQLVTFTATIVLSGSGAGTPTGTATFFEAGSQIGVGSLKASGQATITIASLTVGPHTAITATYHGDAIFKSSTSPAYTHTVNMASTLTNLTSGPNPSQFGQVAAFTATVAISGAGGGTPTGTVAFFEGGTSLGARNLDANGRAILATSALTIGTHSSITATYGGNPNYHSSMSNAYTHIVDKVDTTTSVAAVPNPSMFGQPVTFTVAVNGLGSVTPTGALTFTIDGIEAGAVLLINGTATLVTSTLLTGTHPVTATYGGSANFNASVGILSGGQVVNGHYDFYLPVVMRQ